MRLRHIVLMALLCSPLPGWSQTARELREWAIMGPRGVERLPDAVRSYANSIGCNVPFNPNNLARWEGDAGVRYIALVTLDEGCSGDTGSWRSILLAVRQGANATLLIHPDDSLPKLSSEAFPQMIDSISATVHGVRFAGRVPQVHDDHNNPSKPVAGTIVWTGREWAVLD
ncbi:MAG: hypothetical protein ACREP4_11725 [Stenotrophomonas sp.]|uniref:hypothetical protein n=1 Tax=Stenotrophomonas sp. TaxID=69392 RepID=UPI003D6D9F33